MASQRHAKNEWPTVCLVAACYLALGATTTAVADFSLLLATVLTTVLVAFQSSLQHEVIHGHPLRSRFWSVAMVFPAVGLLIPFERFRDTHLKHHEDPKLTDPYEDPETNYLDPVVWNRLPKSVRLLLRFNNTLLGRLLVGPAISQFVFMRADWQQTRVGDRAIARAWLLHAVGAVPVVGWVLYFSSMPLPAYLVAAYFGLSLLKIRTFLEHRAHERPRGRTVIVNDRGPLALLFLNNNFHLVHHKHPSVPWYQLPGKFDRNRELYLRMNEGYIYKSYVDVFAQHFLKAKDPVPHPLWHGENQG